MTTIIVNQNFYFEKGSHSLPLDAPLNQFKKNFNNRIVINGGPLLKQEKKEHLPLESEAANKSGIKKQWILVAILILSFLGGFAAIGASVHTGSQILFQAGALLVTPSIAGMIQDLLKNGSFK